MRRSTCLLSRRRSTRDRRRKKSVTSVSAFDRSIFAFLASKDSEEATGLREQVKKYVSVPQKSSKNASRRRKRVLSDSSLRSTNQQRAQSRTFSIRLYESIIGQMFH